MIAQPEYSPRRCWASARSGLRDVRQLTFHIGDFFGILLDALLLLLDFRGGTLGIGLQLRVSAVNCSLSNSASCFEVCHRDAPAGG